MVDIDVSVGELSKSTGELHAKQCINAINKKLHNIFDLKTHNVSDLRKNKLADEVAKRLGLTGIPEIDEMLKLYDALDKAGLVKMRKVTNK